jgi:hypothetical protein
MRNDKSGLLDLLNDIGHSEGLSRASHTQKGLVRSPFEDTFTQGLNGLGLIAFWPKFGNELKPVHVNIILQ